MIMQAGACAHRQRLGFVCCWHFSTWCIAARFRSQTGKRWGNRLAACGWLKILGAALQADGETRSPCVTGLKHQKEKRGMDHFAGLDVSVKETSVCIVVRRAKLFGK